MSKKGQEEIAGFIIILVIVAIVFLIMIAFMIANTKKQGAFSPSEDVAQQLEAIMGYTSECAINYEPAYAKLGELIRECKIGKKCVSGQSSCESLRGTLSALLESSLFVGENRPIKGYDFVAYLNESDTTTEIIRIKKGNCTENMRGASYLSPGGIVSDLRLCT